MTVETERVYFTMHTLQMKDYRSFNDVNHHIIMNNVIVLTQLQTAIGFSLSSDVCV